ncbi:hypothetical protein AgCh_038507 [Apium graveolens]
MNRTKLPIRKRLENVPQSSESVDAAVAEVGATNRLANPILYLDILGDFWNIAVARTVVHEDQSSTLLVNCQIKGQRVEITEADMNLALNIPTDKIVEIPTQEKLYDFLDFINYSEKINLDSLNRKNVM